MIKMIHNIFLLLLVVLFSFNLYAGKPDDFYKKARKLIKHSPKEALENYSEAIRYSDASWKKRAQCLNDRAELLMKMKN